MAPRRVAAVCAQMLHTALTRMSMLVAPVFEHQLLALLGLTE